MKTPRLLGIAAALSLSVSAMASSDSFPTRPITLVVPYTAGGSADVVARHVSKAVSETLRQPVVVDNRAGAGGMIGTGSVARAPADGYTLLLATSNIYSINHILYGKSAQTALSALTPVIHLAEAPVVIAASNGLQVTSFPALLEVARQRPNGLTYGTPGIGTEHHLLGELIARSAGVKLMHVPYKGAASAISDLASGQIDLLITLASTAQLATGTGKARLVGVASSGSYALLPQVSTIEQSLKGVNMMVSYGLMAPARTPDSVLRKLNDAFQKALNNPEVRTRIQEAGYTLTGGSADHFARRIADERRQREPIIRQANIKPE